MAAEPLDLVESSLAGSGPYCAGFSRQAAAEQFMTRLVELGISASAMTMLEIAVREPEFRAFVEEGDDLSGVSNAPVTVGAIVGCVLAAVAGYWLNRSTFLSLSILETLVVYFLALMMLGTVLGAAVGAIWASYSKSRYPRVVTRLMADCYLVTTRIGPEKLKEVEFLARSMGAKRIRL